MQSFSTSMGIYVGMVPLFRGRRVHLRRLVQRSKQRVKSTNGTRIVELQAGVWPPFSWSAACLVVLFFLASAIDGGTDRWRVLLSLVVLGLSLPLLRLRRRDRLKLGLALCSRPKNRFPDEVHAFLNAVLFLAGVFKLTVRFLFAGDVLTAFDEINHDVLAH